MFSQTPPKNVPVLDTATLVALVTNPQKAAEYWALYEQHRKDYDAYKAAADAYAAELTKRETSLQNAESALKVEVQNYIADKNAFADKLKKLNDFQRAVEDREAALAATQAAKEQEFAGRQAALAAEKAAWEQLVARKEEVLAASYEQHKQQTAELVARENAVAEREAKAEKLAALLKGV